MRKKPPTLTTAMVRECVEKLKKMHAPPAYIKTKAEARKMYEADLARFGKKHAHRWKVGDEYYELREWPR